MKLIHALAVVSLALPLAAEDYLCTRQLPDTCVARIVDCGVMYEVEFRWPDCVSTEAGWMVSTEDGWVKIKTHGVKRSLGQSSAWTPFGTFTLGYSTRTPTSHGQFFTPAVQLDTLPADLSLIGR